MKFIGLIFLFIVFSCSHYNERLVAQSHISRGCLKSLTSIFEDVDEIHHVESSELLKLGIKGIDKLEVHFTIDDGDFAIDLFGELSSEQGQLALGSFYARFVKNDISVLDISVIDVNEKARRRGLQNLMFIKMFEKNPKLKRIKSSFADTNSEALQASLTTHMEKLNKHKYSTLKESFEVLSESERSYFLKEAIKDTPGFRSRVKIGFGFCPGPKSIRIINFNPLSVSFDSCN